MPDTVMIWDGTEFSHVDPDEAKRLVDADKAQYVEGQDALSLKYLHEFTGHTAEAVEPEPAPAPAPKSRLTLTPVPEPEAEPQMRSVQYNDRSMTSDRNVRETPAPAPAAAEDNDWRKHKAAAAKYLEKKAARITRADVERYLQATGAS